MWLAAGFVLASSTIAQEAVAQVRPLVREMLDNLALVQEIGQAIALEDYEQVQRAASELRSMASTLREFDITRLGLDADRDPQFDAFLTALDDALKSLIEAAKQEDGERMLVGLGQVISDGCLACHVVVRDRERLLSPAVLFMSTFLNSWKDMVRGLTTNDYSLIGRRARELAAMSQVLSWDQVIVATFPEVAAAERKQFRAFVHRIYVAAEQIEQAAAEEDTAAVLEASQRMWIEGCLSCHRQFR